MAIAADGRIALSAAGVQRSMARFSGIKFCNGQLMGTKLIFTDSSLQKRNNDNAVRSRIRMSLTAEVAGETKVSFLVSSSNTKINSRLLAFAKLEILINRFRKVSSEIYDIQNDRYGLKSMKRECASELFLHLQLRDLEMEKRDPRTVVAIILGGGAGTRLFPLTKRRAKPAVSQHSYFPHEFHSHSS